MAVGEWGISGRRASETLHPQNVVWNHDWAIDNKNGDSIPWAAWKMVLIVCRQKHGRIATCSFWNSRRRRRTKSGSRETRTGKRTGNVKKRSATKPKALTRAGRFFSFLQRSETHGSGERRWFWMKKIFTGAWKIICVKSVFPLTFPRWTRLLQFYNEYKEILPESITKWEDIMNWLL